MLCLTYQGADPVPANTHQLSACTCHIAAAKCKDYLSTKKELKIQLEHGAVW